MYVIRITAIGVKAAAIIVMKRGTPVESDLLCQTLICKKRFGNLLLMNWVIAQSNIRLNREQNDLTRVTLPNMYRVVARQ